MNPNRFPEGPDWDLSTIEIMDTEISRIGKNFGLDTYPNQYEIITAEQMLNAYSSVGMPVGYNHWSFGKSFIGQEKQYKNGQMGLAYEIVINSSPCINYLMESNTSTMQALVIAHAGQGHNSFFKGNYLFRQNTDAESIIDYMLFAKKYIAECESKYGTEKVELLLDSCHALQNFGVDRYKRPAKVSAETERARQKDRAAYLQSQVNELWSTLPSKEKGTLKAGKSKRFPSEPQENLLYFIEKNAPHLEMWEREVIRIVRKISQYFYPQRQTQVMNEGWACYEGETEFLSQHGWKKIKDYVEGDLVAQYAEDGTVTLVTPDKYVKYENAPLMEIVSEGVNQCVTPNHRMIYRSTRGRINEVRADELDTSVNRWFINYGSLSSKTQLEMSDAELRVMVAVIADGHFNSSRGNNYCQVAFTKSRKIERMEKLLINAGIEYRKVYWSQGRTGFNFTAPERTKTYKNYYSASPHQLAIVCDEAFLWDGCGSNGRQMYCGTDKDNLDFIQYALAMTGHKASLVERPLQHKEGRTNWESHAPMYCVEKLSSRNSTLSGGTITHLDGLHDVYCFSVPSGMLMTRRNNVINVSGNTFWHYTILNQLYEEGIVGDGFMMEFLQSHTSVVYQHPHSRINPYALGFAMMSDIRRICEKPTDEDRRWFPELAGSDWQESLDFAMRNFKDESFISQYLSPKLIRDFHMYSILDDSGFVHLKVSGIHNDEGYKHIRAALSSQYRLSDIEPNIQVYSVDLKGDRSLTLKHTQHLGRPLNSHAPEVMKHVEKLWGFKVKMIVSGSTTDWSV